MNKSGKRSTISTEWAESIDREDDQETPPGADRVTNFNMTLANNNNNAHVRALGVKLKSTFSLRERVRMY